MAASDLATKKAQRALQRGCAEEAIAVATQALQKHPKATGAARVLGLAHAQKGQWLQAVEALEGAAEKSPPVDVLINLGIGCVHLGRLTDARAWLEACVRRFPNQSLGHYNLGVVLASLGDEAGAERAYRREMKLAGNRAQGLANLGLLLSARGQLDEARQVWVEGLARQPQNLDLRLNLAQLDLQAGRGDQAALGFEAYLSAHPNRDDIRTNLGAAKVACGRFQEARAILEDVQRRLPDDPNVLHNLGVALGELRASEAAVPLLVRATQLGQNPETYRGLSTVLNELCDVRGAEATLHQGRERFPEHPGLFVQSYLWLPRLYQSSEDVKTHRARFMSGLEALERTLEPGSPLCGPELLEALDNRNNFGIAYQGHVDVEVQRRYGAIHTELARRYHPLPQPVPRRSVKPRVGWVSSHFKSHTIAKLVRGFFEHATPDALEHVVFHTGRVADQTTKALRDAAHRFVHMASGVDSICRAILDERLDVLVFPDIGMDSLSHALAARRLAPVQAVLTGHPQTTGYPEIDVFVSIAMAEPSDGSRSYSETLVTLPGVGYTVDRLKAASPVSREHFQLPAEAPVFVSPQTLYKYHPQFDEVYARILQEAPDAYMVFLAGKFPAMAKMFASRLRGACAVRGFDPGDRLRLLPPLSQDDFGRLHQVSDVLLDSLPFSSYTSVLEAWAHTPIPLVAMEGTMVRERLAAGLLRQVGLDELVADTPNRFVEIALGLMQSVELRTQASNKLDQNRSGLYADPAPTRALEKLLSAWARGERGV